jgi:hypothetical protein
MPDAEKLNVRKQWAIFYRALDVQVEPLTLIRQMQSLYRAKFRDFLRMPSR